MEINTPDTNLQTENSSLKAKAFIYKYLRQWKWFVLGLIISFSASYLYLRYSTPLFRANATLLIKANSKDGFNTDMLLFKDVQLNTESDVDNQIEILKSRSLISKTVKSLNLTTGYFVNGRFKDVDIYDKSPVTITFFDPSLLSQKQNLEIFVKIISDKEFEILNNDLKLTGKHNFGEEIKSNAGSVVVTKNYTKKANYNEIKIKIIPLENVINYYLKKLAITKSENSGNMLKLSITESVKEKGIDFLNMHIAKYNEETMKEKKAIGKNTNSFINQRLDSISNELNNVENVIEQFKVNNKITDLPLDMQRLNTNAGEQLKSLSGTSTQLKIVRSMIKFIKDTDNSTVIPYNIIPEAKTATLIEQYNQLVIDKNRIASVSTPQNPTYLTINRQLEGLKSSILVSLANEERSLKIAESDLKNQTNSINTTLSNVPRQEKELRGISRRQNVKEALYLFLLEKREENIIALSVTAPNTQIIDEAYVEPSVVIPLKEKTYTIALGAGLIIPFLILLLIDFLDTKVRSVKDLEYLNIPLLGDVPHIEGGVHLIQSQDRSAGAEAVRIIRTNLEFILNNVPANRAKTIFVTSTIPQEGKTFISVNLAATIAMSGKKILLIGMDIRNPKFDNYFDIPETGLTNYLCTNDAKIDSYIIKNTEISNLHILPPGIIPPNPSELLLNSKLSETIKELKKEYDYIIADTAPVSLVSDTLSIAYLADASIYVVKAGYTEKNLLETASALYYNKKLPNIALLLNATAVNYGYGYGYGYVNEKRKSRWSRLFKRRA